MSTRIPWTDDDRLEIGIDDDLEQAIIHNLDSFNNFDLKRFMKVVAVVEGENEGPDWSWLIQVRPDSNVTGYTRENGMVPWDRSVGRISAYEDRFFIIVRGSCDYTGWDCQSWCRVVHEEWSTPLRMAAYELTDYDWFNDMNKDTSDNSNYCSGEDRFLCMLDQIAIGQKADTWRDKMNREYNSNHYVGPNTELGLSIQIQDLQGTIKQLEARLVTAERLKTLEKERFEKEREIIQRNFNSKIEQIRFALKNASDVANAR